MKTILSASLLGNFVKRASRFQLPGRLSWLAALLLTAMGLHATPPPLTYSGQSTLPLYGAVSAAYGNGAYVVVGANYIYRSTDGTNWNIANSTLVSTNYTSVTFGQGVFVAVAADGSIVTSTNGAGWAHQTSPTANWLYKVAYLNGKFIAGGYAGVVLTSLNATNWSLQNLGTNNGFTSITYGAGKYLMTSYPFGNGTGLIFQSPTGTNSWTSGTVYSGDYHIYNDVVWLNNKFYCFCIDATNFTSTDGTTWTQMSSPQITNPNQVFGGMYTNGTYYVYGSDTNGTYGAIYTSTDGANFSEILPKTTTDVIQDLVYGNGLFIECGGGGFAVSADAGGHWRYPSGNYLSVAYNGTNYVAVGLTGSSSDGYIITSPDWVNWTNVTPTSKRVQGLASVVSSKGKFVAVGYGGDGLPYAPILTSTNGYDWLETNAPNNDDYLSVAADNNGTLVAASDYGNLIRSTNNGVSWTLLGSLPASAANGFYSIAYINSQFVAVGGGGAVIYSTDDGVTWSDASYTGDTGATLVSVTYGSGGYILLGADSTNYMTFLMKRTSLSSGSWAVPSSPPPSVLYPNYGWFVTYANGDYLEYYNDTNGEAYLSTSSDGNTWTRYDLNSQPLYEGVTYANNNFRLVGYNDFKGLATYNETPPTIQNTTNLYTENVTLTFAATNFNDPSIYFDTYANALAKIQVLSLPSAAVGTLELYGAPIQVNQEVPGAQLSGITFVPAANTTATTTFTWKANDGLTYSTAATYTLSAVVANVSPVFVGSTTTLLVGENAGATDVTGLLHVSDSDSGQTETWTQSTAPAHGTLTITGATASSGGSNIAPGGTITYAPTGSYFGSDSFAVQVSDGVGGTATRTITVTVNPPPGITSPLTANGTNASTFSYTITASNSPTSFGATGLPAGLTVNTGNGVISGTPTTFGSFPVVVSATNVTGFGIATLSLTIANTNIPPVFVGSTTTLLVGENAAATDITSLLHVSDPDASQTETWTQSSAPAHGTLTITSATASSGGNNIVSGGTITYTPTSSYFGSDSFAVQVGDGVGGTAIRTITVTVNPPPGITSPLTANGTNASTFSYTITASNSPTSFGATGLPAGLTVNTGNGVISGTPTTFGSFPVVISATNVTGFGIATLSLTIANTNTPPVFVGSTTTLLVGENASATDITGLLHVSDPDSSQTETWTQSSAPSHGTLTITSATASSGGNNIVSGGTITYTPTSSYFGSDSFAVQVSDGAGGTATRTITVTVNPLPGITSGSVSNGIYGSAFTYTITASNSPTSYGATGLPAGLSVDTTSGIISGTPVQSGIYPVTISATNITSFSTATLTLTIAQVNLTVSGITANDRNYNGNNVATLNLGGATLNGVVNNDVITLNTSGVSATFADANVGSGKTVTIAGLALSGTQSTNYTLTQPVTTASILPARAIVTLHRSVQLYDGTAKSVTATTLPLGLPVNVTYNGGPAPSAVGAYTVVGLVANPNYIGGATNYLYVVMAPEITDVHGDGTNISFTWTSMPQVNYQVVYTPSLLPITWTNFNGPVTATDTNTTSLDLIDQASPSRFYRVKVILE